MLAAMSRVAMAWPIRPIPIRPTGGRSDVIGMRHCSRRYAGPHKAVALPLTAAILDASAVEREGAIDGLDHSDLGRDLHRARDQRLPAGRVLISRPRGRHVWLDALTFFHSGLILLRRDAG